MRLLSRFQLLPLLATGLLLLGTLYLRAQDSPTFSTDTRLVVLHASVTDNRGKLLTNLQQNAFKVYENGIQQQVKIFKREDVPVSLGLLIDDSGSMLQKRSRVASAALSLVKASNKQDQVFIVNFNDEAYLDVPFTDDISKMEKALDRIDARGGTAMRDAVNMSLDYMKSDAKRDKKVLMVITDGNDNASNTSLERVVQRALQSETLVYAIGLLSDEEKREAKKAKRALQELTNASGGVAYYPKQVSDVEELTQTIARDIRNQYTIAYSPTEQALDGTYRQIKVTVDGPGKPTVRTRTGYYAKKDQDAPRKQAGLQLPAKPSRAN